MNIAIVLGTARKGRKSEFVAKHLHDHFTKRDGAKAVYVDVKDHLKTFATTRFGKEEAEAAGHLWQSIACDADGFVFVIPEYNHGYPGEWKLLLDSLYKKEYMGKVAGLVGVSSGALGGARAIELATLTLSTRGMYVMKDALRFPHVEELFDGEGTLTHKEQESNIETFSASFMETLTQFRA